MATVSGKVYFDRNQNSKYDAGEAPISGVTLELCGEKSSLYATTNELGEYSFTVPYGGSGIETYTLCCGIERTDKTRSEKEAMEIGKEEAAEIGKEEAAEQKQEVRLKEQALESFDKATRETEAKVSISKVDEKVQEDFGYFKKVDAPKKASVPEVVVGQIYQYTIDVINYDSNVLETVVVSDPLANDIKLVSGSVTVDGIPHMDADIMAGLDIGSIPAASGTTYPSKEVKFDVEAVQKTADVIENQSTIAATYYEKGNPELQSMTKFTNVEKVALAKPEVTIEKIADKDSVKINDIITYTVKISNTGDTKLTEVRYKDIISDAVELVDDTVVLNGSQIQNADLEAGINVNINNPGESAVLSYKVRVIGGSCSGYITNKAYATYRYVLSNRATGTGTSKPVCVDVKADIALFKQITIDTACHIPSAKPDIEEMDNISIEAEIYNSYAIRTPKTVTNEDQVLSGYKLVVHGTLNVVVQYTAYCRDRSVHSAHYNLPFSSFIILPPDYVMGTPIEVSAIVEHAGTEVVGKKEIFINVALLLIANIA